MKDSNKPEFAGLFIILAIATAVIAFFVSEARAWDQEQDQSQWQEMTQALDINVSPMTFDNDTINVTTEAPSIVAEGDTIDSSNQLVLTAPEQTPSVFAGTLIPTASCRGALGATGAVPGVAAGIQLAPKDKECNKRELARMFAGMGEMDFALKLLCTAKDIPAELLDVCPQSSTVTNYAKRVTGILLEESEK